VYAGNESGRTMSVASNGRNSMLRPFSHNPQSFVFRCAAQTQEPSDAPVLSFELALPMARKIDRSRWVTASRAGRWNRASRLLTIPPAVHVPASKNRSCAIYHGCGQGASPMRHGRIGQFVLAFTLVAFGVGLVQAAELEAPRVRHRHVYRHAIVLPPERHVIEVEKYAYSDRFIINGARFAAKSPVCVSGWLAGERVRLLSGE